MQPDMIYCGDALETLKEWPDSFVHSVVTSPPYWALRDYKVDGQYGLEKTPEEYIENMVNVFREVRRVMRDDATLWLNMGDAYAQGKGRRFSNEEAVAARQRGKDFSYPNQPSGWTGRGDRAANTAVGILKSKDLVGMPWRLAFALQADGWWLRSDIIWHKPNPMPESASGTRWERCRVKLAQGKTGQSTLQCPGYALSESEAPDFTRPHSVAVWRDCPGCARCEKHGGYVLRRGSGRPTKSHEYIFLLAKSANYYYDCEAVRESYAETTLKDQRDNDSGHRRERQYPGQQSVGGTNLGGLRASGRNKRSVWTVPTFPYPGAHYATFPPKLIEPCILAGTSEKGCCPKCGTPWARVLERKFVGSYHVHKADGIQYGKRQNGKGPANTHDRPKFRGWRPMCECSIDTEIVAALNDGKHKSLAELERMDVSGLPKPSVVLDPFMGHGTTGLVARKLGRHYIGIEINPKDVEAANERIRKATELPLFDDVGAKK